MENGVRVVIKIAVYLNERAGAEKSVPAFDMQSVQYIRAALILQHVV
ncbi:hypothetical protein ROSINTL182_07423 [Roseburia intestinalis L1-82]|uniref:Uncharacterized protein n=1 Tax=Roseburia intestinalis L1-82 TaxID=536231 RepID=C7GBY8_9FIRM|nr:hypothetical protein ROSINTL182_07423 [Roseburia intestinalis L1-82]